MGDDVSGAVDLDGVVAEHLVRAVGADRAPQGAGPADEEIALLGAAEEDVVGDVEVGRAGVLGPDAEADVLEAAVLDGEADGAELFLAAGEDADVGVADGDAVEDVIGGGHHVKHVVVAGAVEDDLAVAGGLDGDGLVGVPFRVSDMVPSKGVIMGST